MKRFILETGQAGRREREATKLRIKNYIFYAMDQRNYYQETKSDPQIIKKIKLQAILDGYKAKRNGHFWAG